MARGTIVGDGLTVGAGMAAIVAAETPRRIVVPEIVGVNAPGHAHVGEDVAKVDVRHFISRFLHQRATRLVDLWIIRPVELVEFFEDALLGHIARGIIHLEEFDRLFLDVRKFGADTSERHLLVDRVFGQLESMRGTIMAVHAIHRAVFSLVQLLLGRLRIGGNKFSSLSAIVGVIHDRDRLPLGVGRYVADAHGVRQMVPVDADRPLLSAIKRRFEGCSSHRLCSLCSPGTCRR